MTAKKLKLFTKILLFSIMPFVLLGLTLQCANYVISSKNLAILSGNFKSTLDELSRDSTRELTMMSEQAARDLLREIRIAVGNSLQPGESAKFLNLAKEQVKLDQVHEFSFYGPGGRLELSSNEDTARPQVPEAVFSKAVQTKELVIEGNEESCDLFNFYQPLFVDRDMQRMNPDMNVGDLYGMLFVAFDKQRILNSLNKQRQQIAQAEQQTQQIAQTTLRKGLFYSAIISAAFLCVTTVVIVPLVKRTVINPMRKTITANRQISEYLNLAAKQFSSASETIAQGATEQAATFEETSSSLMTITSMTQNNANNAAHANTLAAQAKDVAISAADSIQKMDQAMQEIRRGADMTSKIIKAIDEIAFQTNLLALNAAVEAARAGEAGKGFAVVADEVRNLAMRSADAARETSEMIEKSIQQSQNGVQIANTVRQTLLSITEHVTKTADLINEISLASQEQSHSIESVNQAISQMEVVTQQNAANAEESASSARELDLQADQLDETVKELVDLVGITTLRRETVDKRMRQNNKHHEAAPQRAAFAGHEVTPKTALQTR